jgi:hypothetical protein
MKDMRYLVPGVLIGFILLFASCKREEVVRVAGKGGNASLRITPVHGSSETIESCTLYLRYNTLDKPANNKYDEQVECNRVDGKLMGAFSDLKTGDYYIYGVGYNPDHGDTVRGGYPITIEEERLHTVTLQLGH